LEVVINNMRRTIKKEINLNKLNTCCSPCMSEAKKMEQKIFNRNVSEIKIEEVKTIVSQCLKKIKSLTSISLALNACYILHSSRFSQRTLHDNKIN